MAEVEEWFRDVLRPAVDRGECSQGAYDSAEFVRDQLRDVVSLHWAYLDTADPDVEENRRILFRFVTVTWEDPVNGSLRIYIGNNEGCIHVAKEYQGHSTGLFYPQGMESHAIAKIRALLLIPDIGQPQQILDYDVYVTPRGTSIPAELICEDNTLAYYSINTVFDACNFPIRG